LDCAGKAKRRRRFSRALSFFAEEKRCGAALPTALQRITSPAILRNHPAGLTDRFSADKLWLFGLDAPFARTIALNTTDID